ncbi:unnamed protein product [Amoebophrya sp. A120]|nr:unnamed protein product [Amoebophrya sp. A120]|eukprot:GSA120T00003869001.1
MISSVVRFILVLVLHNSAMLTSLLARFLGQGVFPSGSCTGFNAVHLYVAAVQSRLRNTKIKSGRHREDTRSAIDSEDIRNRPTDSKEEGAGARFVAAPEEVEDTVVAPPVDVASSATTYARGKGNDNEDGRGLVLRGQTLMGGGTTVTHRRTKSRIKPRIHFLQKWKTKRQNSVSEQDQQEGETSLPSTSSPRASGASKDHEEKPRMIADIEKSHREDRSWENHLRQHNGGQNLLQVSASRKTQGKQALARQTTLLHETKAVPRIDGYCLGADDFLNCPTTGPKASVSFRSSQDDGPEMQIQRPSSAVRCRTKQTFDFGPPAVESQSSRPRMTVRFDARKVKPDVNFQIAWFVAPLDDDGPTGRPWCGYRWKHDRNGAFKFRTASCLQLTLVDMNGNANPLQAGRAASGTAVFPELDRTGQTGGAIQTAAHTWQLDPSTTGELLLETRTGLPNDDFVFSEVFTPVDNKSDSQEVVEATPFGVTLSGHGAPSPTAPVYADYSLPRAWFYEKMRQNGVQIGVSLSTGFVPVQQGRFSQRIGDLAGSKLALGPLQLWHARVVQGEEPNLVIVDGKCVPRQTLPTSDQTSVVTEAPSLDVAVPITNPVKTTTTPTPTIRTSTPTNIIPATTTVPTSSTSTSTVTPTATILPTTATAPITTPMPTSSATDSSTSASTSTAASESNMTATGSSNTSTVAPTSSDTEMNTPAATSTNATGTIMSTSAPPAINRLEGNANLTDGGVLPEIAGHIGLPVVSAMANASTTGDCSETWGKCTDAECCQLEMEHCVRDVKNESERLCVPDELMLEYFANATNEDKLPAPPEEAGMLHSPSALRSAIVPRGSESGNVRTLLLVAAAVVLIAGMVYLLLHCLYGTDRHSAAAWSLSDAEDAEVMAESSSDYHSYDPSTGGSAASSKQAALGEQTSKRTDHGDKHKSDKQAEALQEQLAQDSASSSSALPQSPPVPSPEQGSPGQPDAARKKKLKGKRQAEGGPGGTEASSAGTRIGSVKRSQRGAQQLVPAIPAVADSNPKPRFWDRFRRNRSKTPPPAPSVKATTPPVVPTPTPMLTNLLQRAKLVRPAASPQTQQGAEVNSYPGKQERSPSGAALSQVDWESQLRQTDQVGTSNLSFLADQLEDKL